MIADLPVLPMMVALNMKTMDGKTKFSKILPKKSIKNCLRIVQKKRLNCQSRPPLSLGAKTHFSDAKGHTLLFYNYEQPKKGQLTILLSRLARDS